ncbi:aminotransferase class I/II-fold pyridoxal phosphate-dependent enzyme [Chloroflexi bacterium TSY]|nr:aminotransferase class I/II-fold pyridoxal phosphate-dependent enzyme [Chloroflexi bacterium TSY]
MNKLSPDKMRKIGYQVIDMLVDHYDTVAEKPVTRNPTRAKLEELLREPLPIEGTEIDPLLSQLRDDVFANVMHVDHPRFFAFVPSPSNFISVMAETLIAGHNVFAGIWMEGAGAAQIELIALDWLRQACGMPDSAGGIFLSGGSMANITGIAVARHLKLGGPNPDAVIYTSEQTHSSIERGLKFLGFYPDQLRKVPVGNDYRMDLNALAKSVRSDQVAGQVPFCVVANAGTTNTGAIDPLPEIADFCEQHDLWFHVDGAYGAAAALSARGKAKLTGMERAHSLVLDPHKWLFQPFSMGCLLVQHERWLRETFHIRPEYLADVEAEFGAVNFCDRSVQLTREFSALKYFGQSAFASAIEHGFEAAELTERLIRAKPDWQIFTPAQMGIVTFRYAPGDWSLDAINVLNGQLVDDIIADGFAMITSTVLRGQTVLRMCTINPRTTDRDIQQTTDWLDDLAKTRSKRTQ